MHIATSDFDIAIVGLGPVGAVAANLAGAAGFRTLVLERAEQPYLKPRAIVFDAEIMRIFASIGLAQSIANASRALEGSIYLGADRKPIRTFRARARAHELAWHPSNLFYQPQLEQILRDGLARFPNVTVLHEHDVTGMRQNDDGCVLHVTSVASSSPPFEARARFILACDGASSTIRKALNIGLDDIGFEERWLVLDAFVSGPMHWPKTHAIPEEVRSGRYSLMVCDPARPSTLIPGVGRHRRWEYMLMPGEHDEDVVSEAWLRERLSLWIDPEHVEIVRAAVYKFRALIARRWRMKSAFLVGDAAHQTPPFYGQGMCHGIRDAAQLIWKLRLVVDGETSAAALDSYQAEREPHVREIIAASVAAGAQVCKVDPDEAAARDAEFRRIEAARSSASVAMTDVVPPMRAGILDPASGGMCLPEFVRVAPDGSLRRVDELLAGRFTILSAEDGVECLAGEIAARWRQLNGHEITLGRDSDGSFALWLGRQRARWVIVRPDRYVYATAADQRALCAQLERLFVQLGVRETTDHRWGRKDNDNPVIATLKPDSESSMKPLKFSLNHLGLYVIDIDLMTDFYTSFFGFVITDRRDDLNKIRFMTMSPDEHHQLLLAAGRKADSESTVNQVSFLMEDFASLRRLYERATTDKRVRKVWAVDHGNSWTVYFKDPEDNTIECYVHSPWHVSQPYGVPIDFTLSDEQIYRRTEAASLANPTYKTAETYRSELTQRLRERAQ